MHVSVSAFALLVVTPIGIASPAVGLKIFEIIAISKRRKKHDKIVLLAKSLLNNKEVSISKALIDSNISHGKFVSVNYMLKEYDYLKEAIKNLKKY